jgi:CDP-6-deoxy-D-xylo-4-hexulose-3-dehydrase
MFWPLMKDCITEKDKNEMIEFIRSSTRFTNGEKVREFEKRWSEWLGCKRSLFVSSGSTANLLLVAAIKEKYGLKDGDKVLVPAMTWVTNISPVMQLGLKPIFCDVDKSNFGFDMDHLKAIKKDHPDIRLIFVTHLFGICAPIDLYEEIFPEAVFIEDVCESHGAVYKGKKAGTLSAGSTFSFYFGHHMTTVEGGFVSTDDEDLYNLMKMKRSHGLAREATPENYELYKKKYPDVHEQFLFITDGFNFRNTEINAVLGLSQLKSLNTSVQKRRENYNRFLRFIEKYDEFEIPSEEGNSSFCLPFICKSAGFKIKLEKFLNDRGVETRPLCSGNLLRQPFLEAYGFDTDIQGESNVDYLHDNGFFIGNNHMITSEDFDCLEEMLVSVLEDNQ